MMRWIHLTLGLLMCLVLGCTPETDGGSNDRARGETGGEADTAGESSQRDERDRADNGAGQSMNSGGASVGGQTAEPSDSSDDSEPTDSDMSDAMSCQPDCVGKCAGDDGCGGECPINNCVLTGQTCGVDGRCAGECTPVTCATRQAQCGNPADGCGNTLTCGDCPETFACNQQFVCATGGCDRGFELNEAGECVETDKACIRLTKTGLTVHPPAGLRVLFRASDCDGNPISALGEGDVEVINLITGQAFGDGGEGGGISSPTTPSSYGLYSVLSLDMSGSVFEQNAQGSVFNAAETFLRAMLENAPESLRPKVAIQVFGRSADTRIVQPFSDDLEVLLNTLNTLRTEQMPLGSTNLYGAYRSAIDAVLAEGQTLEIVERSVVIFTDGVHEAGDLDNQRRLALEAKALAEINHKLTAFSVYSGTDNDQDAIGAIRELASDDGAGFRTASLDDIEALTAAFEGFAQRLRDIAQSNYVVGVCTPVELGEGRMSIIATADGVVSEPLVLFYPTDNLNGDVSPDSCNPLDLAEPCNGRQCGSGAIENFQCGRCDIVGPRGSMCVENQCQCEGGPENCGPRPDGPFTMRSTFDFDDAQPTPGNFEALRSIASDDDSAAEAFVELMCQSNYDFGDTCMVLTVYNSLGAIQPTMNEIRDTQPQLFALLGALSDLPDIVDRFSVQSILNFGAAGDDGIHTWNQLEFTWNSSQPDVRDPLCAPNDDCRRTFDVNAVHMGRQGEPMEIASAFTSSLDRGRLQIDVHELTLDLGLIAHHLAEQWLIPSALNGQGPTSVSDALGTLMRVPAVCGRIDATVSLDGFCDQQLVPSLISTINYNISELGDEQGRLTISGTAEIIEQNDDWLVERLADGGWTGESSRGQDVEGCFDACRGVECEPMSCDIAAAPPGPDGQAPGDMQNDGQANAGDIDGDGVLNGADNCPTVANQDQTDTDDDRRGDACDDDIDNDGVANGADNCPTIANADQANNPCVDHNDEDGAAEDGAAGAEGAGEEGAAGVDDPEEAAAGGAVAADPDVP
ncbi:MAG: vWA domain-containing protein [Myxococcota bacterium]|nr:vWA domain-containing protein [Myxococcota bacterium]